MTTSNALDGSSAANQNQDSGPQLSVINPKPSRNEQMRVSIYETGTGRFYKAAAEELGIERGDSLRFASSANGQDGSVLYMEHIEGGSDDRDTIDVYGDEEEGRVNFRAKGLFDALGVDLSGGLLYRLDPDPVVNKGKEYYRLDRMEDE